MVGIVLVEWKSYLIAKCAHIFQNVQAGLTFGLSIFKGDTSALLRVRVYNKVYSCLEGNSICC